MYSVTDVTLATDVVSVAVQVDAVVLRSTPLVVPAIEADFSTLQLSRRCSTADASTSEKPLGGYL